MREAAKFQKLKLCSLSAHHTLKKCKKLSVIRTRVGIIIKLARRRCAVTLAVTLAGIRRFEFRLLSRRNEMRVFFQIFDNLFGNHFALKTAQRTLDRFVVIN